MHTAQMYIALGTFLMQVLPKTSSRDGSAVQFWETNLWIYTGFLCVFHSIVSAHDRIPFGTKIGFDWAWLTFALITIVFFIPMVFLMKFGERWRRNLVDPTVQ